MLRKLSLPTLLVVAVLAPAAPSHAACPHAAEVTLTGSVVVCQGGKERTILRSTATTRYVAAARTKTRLATVKVKGERGTVELRTWPARKLVFRRAVEIDADLMPQIALHTRGALAWSTSGDVLARTAAGRVLIWERATHTGRVELTREGALIAGSHEKPIVHDLRKVERRGGCPVRSGGTVVRDTPTGRLTLHGHLDDGEPARPGYEPLRLLRLCIKSSGAERVIPFGGSDYSWGDRQAVAGAVGDLVFVTSTRWDEADCTGGGLDRIDLATGTRVRIAQNVPWNCVEEELFPVAGNPLVATTAGLPAWVRDGVLRGVNAQGQIVELDRGAITDLATDGTTIRWKRDGADRQAAL